MKPHQRSKRFRTDKGGIKALRRIFSMIAPEYNGRFCFWCLFSIIHLHSPTQSHLLSITPPASQIPISDPPLIPPSPPPNTELISRHLLLAVAWFQHVALTQRRRSDLRCCLDGREILLHVTSAPPGLPLSAVSHSPDTIDPHRGPGIHLVLV